MLGFGKKRKYSKKWFESISDAVLNSEREKVRKAYCSSGRNYKKACFLENLLGLFDAESSRRAWKGRKPSGPSYRREHGYNLFKPD